MPNPAFGVGRAPCGGWPAAPVIRLNCGSQHNLAAHTAIARFVSTTKVPDYASPPGADINPYEKPNAIGAIPVCGGSSPCGGVGQPVCGPWPEPVPANTFAASGAVDLSATRKRGFKNVQAMKWWHGRRGNNSPDWFAPDTLTVYNGAPGGGYAVGQITHQCREAVFSPDETRYRTMNITAVIDVVDNVPNFVVTGGTRTVSAYSQMTVDRYSGVQTGAATIPAGGAFPATPDHDDLLILLAKAEDHVNGLYNAFKLTINNLVASGGQAGVLTLANTGSLYRWTWTADAGITRIFTINAIAGTFRDQEWFYNNPNTIGSPLVERTDILWSLTGTGLSYTDVFEDYTATAHVKTKTCVATLSNPYTGADLQADLDALLGQWNLGDDAQYPWRSDNHVSEAPLVVRHEVQQAVGPVPITVTGTYTDANAANFTGAILGAPLAAGYEGFFDFRHEVWRKCTSIDGPQWYVRGFGSLAPSYLPKNATRWTNWNQANQWGRLGAFVIHFPGVRVAQKWAETKEVRLSRNYARPCGTDTSPASPDCIVDDPWFDDRSKGDYTRHEWGYDRRDMGEYQRMYAASCNPGFANPRQPEQASFGIEQAVASFTCSTACLSPGICSPAILCISPNGETFSSGTTTVFGPVKADDVYGDQWQGIFIQTVDDPLWVVPPAPSGWGGQWLRDSGGCQIDTAGIKYYAMPRQVEARCEKPAGAPVMPAGYDNSFLTFAEFGAATSMGRNKSFPPFPLLTDSIGQPMPVATVWSILTAQEACVCLPGVFASTYAADGVKCGC